MTLKPAAHNDRDSADMTHKDVRALLGKVLVESWWRQATSS